LAQLERLLAPDRIYTARLVLVWRNNAVDVDVAGASGPAGE
jgi:hypothetical protein